MKEEKQSKGIWWKTLIVLTFIISLICLGILVQNEFFKYEYYTKIITLENDNIIEYFDGKIVDYLCDEGVVTNVYKTQGYFYASTWEGTYKVKPKGMNGQCMIKVRRRI